MRFFSTCFLDAPVHWQIGFQDPASPIITGIIHFHNHLIYYLLLIGTFVVFLLFRAWLLFKTSKPKTCLNSSKFTHSTPLEVVWTITPALLLVLIAGPSFTLLYSMDEVVEPGISLKVIGHQWYWSYEYGDFFKNKSGKTINFDAYILGEDDLSFGGLRLLEVDNRVKLPINQHIKAYVSSADVIHSWALPSLGIKIDACPGRLNQVSLILLRKGIFYGQCSEICGVNHGFMPIVIESLEKTDYLDWVNATLGMLRGGPGNPALIPDDESSDSDSGGESQPQGELQGEPQGQPQGEPQGQPHGQPQGEPQGQAGGRPNPIPDVDSSPEQNRRPNPQANLPRPVRIPAENQNKISFELSKFLVKFSISILAWLALGIMIYSHVPYILIFA